MVRARVEVDLSIFLAKTFCDTTFFSSLDDFCIVDEKRQALLGLRDHFSSQSWIESEVRKIISLVVMIRLGRAES